MEGDKLEVRDKASDIEAEFEVVKSKVKASERLHVFTVGCNISAYTDMDHIQSYAAS
jgi:ABC-type enterochelin transport system substrate-binding protein